MQSIAIIGAGYAGLSLALHIQHYARSELQIHLLGSGATIGRGVAYTPNHAEALLNVPAGKMGALVTDPEYFVEWLQQQGKTVTEADFVPRQWYGEYLASLLRSATGEHALAPIQLYKSEVLRLTPQIKGVSLDLANGERLAVDQAVLALGNFPPANLPIQTPEFYEDPRYFGNPWLPDCIQGLDPQRPILLLGTSLTMIDTVLALRANGHQGQITVISPRGRLPWAVSQDLPSLPDFKPNAQMSLIEILRQIRLNMQGQIDSQAAWQVIANSLRPILPEIWEGLSLRQQQQFLRHLRHPWGLIRHRLPPQISTQIQTLVEQGSLQVLAGRVQALSDSKTGIDLQYLPRSSQQTQHLDGFQRVINCTGPNLDYARLQSPLVQDLLDQGLIRPHPLKLGLLADRSGALLDTFKQPSKTLFSLGPALRGLYWESTAVPEIRQQASRLAQAFVEQAATIADTN